MGSSSSMPMLGNLRPQPNAAYGGHMGVRATRRVLLRGGAGASLAAPRRLLRRRQSGGTPSSPRRPADGLDDRRASPTPSPTPTETPTPTPTAEPRRDPQVAGEVVTGLAVPWGIAFLPDGTALVGERDTGRLLRVSDGSAEPVGTLDVRSRLDEGGETGLLGLALHPLRRQPAALRLPVHRRRQPDRPDDLRRRGSASPSRSSPASAPRPTTTAAAWPSARTGCCTPPPATPRTPPAPRTPARSTARCCG